MGSETSGAAQNRQVEVETDNPIHCGEYRQYKDRMQSVH